MHSADIERAPRRNAVPAGASHTLESKAPRARKDKSNDSTVKVDPSGVRFVSQAGSYPASSNSQRTFEGLRFSPLLSGNRMQVLLPNRRTVRDGGDGNGRFPEADHQQDDLQRRQLNSFQQDLQLSKQMPSDRDSNKRISLAQRSQPQPGPA